MLFSLFNFISKNLDPFIGTNKYRLSQEEEIEILDVDNLAVREAQINRLGIIRKNRDERACLAALEEITRRAEHGGNIIRIVSVVVESPPAFLKYSRRILKRSTAQQAFSGSALAA